MTENSDDSFNSSKAEVFEALGHPTRIRILRELAAKPLTYSELKRAAGMESNGLLTFHLGKMRGLVRLNPEGSYALTDEGREALQIVEASRNQSEGGSSQRPSIRVPHLNAILTGLVVVLIRPRRGVGDRVQSDSGPRLTHDNHLNGSDHDDYQYCDPDNNPRAALRPGRVLSEQPVSTRHELPRESDAVSRDGEHDGALGDQPNHLALGGEQPERPKVAQHHGISTVALRREPEQWGLLLLHPSEHPSLRAVSAGRAGARLRYDLQLIGDPLLLNNPTNGVPITFSVTTLNSSAGTTQVVLLCVSIGTPTYSFAASQALSTTLNIGGYWSVPHQGDTPIQGISGFQHFSPGHYTMVAFDAFGDSVILPFTVTASPA